MIYHKNTEEFFLHVFVFFPNFFMCILHESLRPKTFSLLNFTLYDVEKSLHLRIYVNKFSSTEVH